MGTFDHLIISMGIHLSHIHGRENVAIVSTDHRLTDILKKCNSTIPKNTVRKLKLDQAEKLTGRAFEPSTFPRFVNLATASKADLANVLGTWPLPVAQVRDVYRWTKT